MATNLKKGKKIRAFFYRIAAAGALFTTIFTAVMGREAIYNLYHKGSGIMTGDLYYLTEFRDYIGSLYHQAMIGYAGIGDDKGYPLTDEYAAKYSAQAYTEFQSEIKNARGDILYHIQIENEKSDIEYGNISYPLFSEYDGHLLLPEDVELCCYWDGPGNKLSFFPSEDGSMDTTNSSYTTWYKPNKENASGIRLVLAVKANGHYASYSLSEMASLAQSYRYILLTFFTGGCLTVLFCLLCLFSHKAAGQARRDFAVFTGKLWLEAKLIFILLFFYICFSHGLGSFMLPLSFRIQLHDMLWLYFPAGCLIYLICTDLRCNKGSIFTNSLLAGFLRYIREFIRGESWQRKAMNMCSAALFCCLAAIISGLGLFGIVFLSQSTRILRRSELYLCMFGILLILGGMLLLLYYFRLRRLVRDTAAITAKLSELQAGAPCTPLLLPGRSLLLKAADDLNKLESGIENAVEQKNRSNKMRVELLTNVSHDLKTPLTSIINYADLLCEEELPQPAAEYASALRQKAYRLKNMVQDVFDLSKATSGNLPVEKTLLDLAKLIRQTLADMDERIQESSLTFKLTISAEPLMIEADGERLYRIFQNLFVNALQYSLDQSRVHVLLDQEDHYAVARVKNISRTELDFDPAEIIERFVRADISRTTEGSGLGLSIVQSFTEACGGTFHISIDADMFTACVRFPLTNPSETDNTKADAASQAQAASGIPAADAPAALTTMDQES